MLLAGRSVAEGKALVDRGVAADAAFPAGTAYLLSTSDRARNRRAAGYTLLDALEEGGCAPLPNLPPEDGKRGRSPRSNVDHSAGGGSSDVTGTAS